MSNPYSSDQTQAGYQSDFPNVQVTTGEINYDSTDSDIKDQPDATSWTDYEIHNHYEKDGHIYMMGVTSPYGFQGNTVAFCQLASPTLLLLCDWTTARWGQKPVVPSLQLNDSGWVLMDIHAETVDITEGPNGETKLFRISGTYVYGHLRPSADIFQNLYWPRPPWLEDTADRSVPGSLQETNTIDAPGGGYQPPSGGLNGFIG